ncbi:hypothetical protein LJC58_07640 [Lachnospiraceae bacterium OttesenSCG-928-D06]|nr:hypothetical protein [Lachnospiraceae bacterium OttesenSCG-928-D06]
MKKIIIITSLAMLFLINIILINGRASTSISEAYENNEQITTLIDKYSEEYNHQFKLATKELEQRIYGNWKIGETLGYSLKENITGGALYSGKLELSKDIYSITTLSPVLYNKDGKTLTTNEFEDYTIVFQKPAFMYYQETIDQMKQDDFLENYSGIEDIDPNTVGTVIIAIGLPSDSSGDYELVTTKFIIIDNHVIVVRQSTFYQLEKIHS